MKKLVIFDLDGTLLDTLCDLRDAVNHTMRYVGRPERTIADVRRFIGNGIRKLIERSLGDNFDDALVDECFKVFFDYYKVHYNVNTVKYDGVDRCIDLLLKNGVGVGVVTNKLNSMAVDLCREHFGDVFVGVVGDVDGMPRKPDPAKVLKMMSDCGCEQCVLVGDSSVDVKTAKNAGIPCVAVSWGFEDRDKLVLLEPEYIADTDKELEEILIKALI